MKTITYPDTYSDLPIMIKNDTHKKNSLNVFEGENAILDFLNPQNTPYPPLVELPESLNPYKRNNIHIYAKLMNFLPLRNIKSLPAYNMLMNAQEQDKLKDVKEIIEPSSGNTIMSLAPIARNLGINTINALIPEYVTAGKLKMLQLFGINIMMYKDPPIRTKDNPDNRVNTSKKLGKENNWFNPSQYDNYDNPQIHEQVTGPQIWEQTNGNIDIFCSGLGSSGTIVGTTKYLRSMNEDLISIGVNMKNEVVPGVRAKEQLQELTFDWETAVDYIEEVNVFNSYKASLSMLRQGIIAGPSSGLTYCGLLQYLSQTQYATQVADEKVYAVFICFDDPFAYVDEYFDILGESFFPQIHHK